MLWNSGTVMVEQCGGTVMVEQCGGTVEQWVQQCCGTVEQWNSDGGTVLMEQ